MGMFDEIRCKAELPMRGFEDRVFQTKDTHAQTLDMYEIREDGTLWHEEYDVEDRSGPGVDGIPDLCGIATRVNKRFEPCIFTGQIWFYDFADPNRDAGWIEFYATFTDGKMDSIRTVSHEPADERQ